MRCAFYTLGCKVNQYETNALIGQFMTDGFDIVSSEDIADVYIINSCTVTASGDKKTRQIMHRFKRQNPNAIIALTGCFPQAFPEVAEKLPEADVIIGASNRTRLLPLVKQCLADGGQRKIEIIAHAKNDEFEKLSITGFAERTRAFVKIQDGCERYCSYCIIPYARGFIRSKQPQDLLDELKTLAKAGYKEVVLVGINLSTYGKELGLRLIDAIELACSVDGIYRVRLGSIEPDLITDEDIARMAAQPKFCPQFHLALQSGSDGTLLRMNRHYTAGEFADLVKRIRLTFDNSAITTDIMVGFAGEDDKEFAENLAFAQEIGFAKAHVFAYSVREGTRAANFENQLSNAIK
ncbi:MAG: tRNA (N(6)-L-threonylcarbamoyladenosine(37)-C(2))-methylthiotransferase MtaB, partial [Oscillospiraceae bacterium]